jgi:hypothetical protein
VQRGDSAAVLDGKKRELEARRAAASRADKVFFKVTVRVGDLDGQDCSLPLQGWMAGLGLA